MQNRNQSLNLAMATLKMEAKGTVLAGMGRSISYAVGNIRLEANLNNLTDQIQRSKTVKLTQSQTPLITRTEYDIRCLSDI